MKRESCNRCVHGLECQRIYTEYKEKKMSVFDFKAKAKDMYTMYCGPCNRNEIGGVKGRLLRKAFPNSFQVLDMFEEVEPNDND